MMSNDVIYKSALMTTVGTLIGITNTLGTLTGFIGPAVVGAVTNENVRIILSRIYVGDRRNLLYKS